MLGRQIAGKPIDHAILQMMFSDKRASKRIKSMLAVARDHAVNYKNLDKSKLVVGVPNFVSCSLHVHVNHSFSLQPRHG